MLSGTAQQFPPALSQQHPIAGEGDSTGVSVAALILSAQQFVCAGSLQSTLSTDVKYGSLLRGRGEHDAVIGTKRPVCSKLGHLALPQVTWNKKSFLKG